MTSGRLGDKEPSVDRQIFDAEEALAHHFGTKKFVELMNMTSRRTKGYHRKREPELPTDAGVTGEKSGKHGNGHQDLFLLL